MHDTAATPSTAPIRSMGNESVSNTLPRTGSTRISGSKLRYMVRTSPSNPLNTDSNTTIAATGIATENALTPEMTLMTECDFFENR